MRPASTSRGKNRLGSRNFIGFVLIAQFATRVLTVMSAKGSRWGAVCRSEVHCPSELRPSSAVKPERVMLFTVAQSNGMGFQCVHVNCAEATDTEHPVGRNVVYQRPIRLTRWPGTICTTRRSVVAIAEEERNQTGGKTANRPVTHDANGIGQVPKQRTKIQNAINNGVTLLSRQQRNWASAVQSMTETPLHIKMNLVFHLISSGLSSQQPIFRPTKVSRDFRES